MTLKNALISLLLWSLLLNLIYISSHIVWISGEHGVNWYWVEIARDEHAREQGLMYRTELADNHGMLFSFPDTEPRTFWMKNTLIPLDMIFLDENKKVVSITSYANPCEDASGVTCARYQSGLPAKYVLELKAGQSKVKQILVGSQAYWILN